jgi:Zn-finger nucleic acid-binding protein
MRCPVCKEPLITLEFEDVEVDFCTECHGVWLDAGELGLLLGIEPGTGEALVAAHAQASPRPEAPRRCPECGRKMEKAVAGKDRLVTYDRCRYGDGLWFDQGELDAVLEHGQELLGTVKVSTFLRDMFPETSPHAPGEAGPDT